MFRQLLRTTILTISLLITTTPTFAELNYLCVPFYATFYGQNVSSQAHPIFFTITPNSLYINNEPIPLTPHSPGKTETTLTTKDDYYFTIYFDDRIIRIRIEDSLLYWEDDQGTVKNTMTGPCLKNK